MLILGRMPGQGFLIGEDIVVRYLGQDGGRAVRLSVDFKGCRSWLTVAVDAVVELAPGITLTNWRQADPRGKRATFGITAPKAVMVDRMEFRAKLDRESEIAYRASLADPKRKERAS